MASFRYSLSSKLAFLFSILVVLVLFSVFLVDVLTKKGDLVEDQFRRAVNFGELFTTPIVEHFVRASDQGENISFFKSIESYKKVNKDIGNIRIWSQEGRLLYSDDQRMFYKQEDAGDEVTVLSKDVVVQDMMMVSTRDTMLRYDTTRDPPFTTLQGEPYVDTVERTSITRITIPQHYGDKKYIVSYDILQDTVEGRFTERVLLSLLFFLFVAIVGTVMIIFFSRGLTKPLLILSEKVRRIADGAYGDTLDVKSHDEIGTLTESVNFLSKRINETTVALIERERLAHDVSMARAIQIELLPKKLPNDMHMDVYAGLVPEEAIGGDMYDIIPLKDEKYLLYVADVTGHGMAAGLLSSIVNTLLFTFASAESVDLQKVAQQLHQTLREKTKPTMFVTLFLGLWDKSKDTLSYISCGHPPVILYREREKKAEFLTGKGVALGIMMNIDKLLQVEQVELQQGDTIFSYSDGVVEAKNKEGTLFGKDRLLSVVQEKDWKSAEALYNLILEEVATFMGASPQTDDITMLVLKKI